MGIPTLTVRKLPPAVVARIKDAAAANRRSMEEEVRVLLAQRFPARADVLTLMRERRRRVAATSHVPAWTEAAGGGRRPGAEPSTVREPPG